MNKHIFIVGTAVEPFMKENYSKYDTQTRFDQTIETIESIRNKAPNSYICLAETSYKEISIEYRNKLKDLTDYYLELWDSEGCTTFYKLCVDQPRSSVYIKSLLETYGMITIMNAMIANQMFTDARRIFKLTGRYVLNDNFNIDDYKSAILDNYIIGKIYDYKLDSDSIKKTSPEQYVYKYKGMIETCFWSFGKYQFGAVFKALNESFDYLQEVIRYTTGSDIEHALYHYLDRNSIISVPTLGVTVRKGFEGTIEDK